MHRSIKDITPTEAWEPDHASPKYVALPWVNDYSGNIQNRPLYVAAVWRNGVLVSDAYYKWIPELVYGLSWQPYLLYITKRICEALPEPYSYDFDEWESNDEYKYLLICNTIPYAWDIPEFARALPHWSVEEYFSKLELFLNGEFTIDHRARHISFNFTTTVLNDIAPETLTNVVEDHSTEVKVDEKQSEYTPMRNLVYKECSHATWKYYSCDWFIKNSPWKPIRYDTLQQLLDDNRQYKTCRRYRGEHMTTIDRLLYAADCDAYFIIEIVSGRTVAVGGSISGGVAGPIKHLLEYYCRLRPINLFGGRIVSDDEDAEQDEIEFVPVRIDDTDNANGRCMFLDFQGYDEPEEYTEIFDGRDLRYQSHTVQTLSAGEKEKKAEYYDRIYVGYWDGSQNTNGKLPYPYAEDVIIEDDWSNFFWPRFSMRINSRYTKTPVTPEIIPAMKTTFKWLSSKIPNPRALFNIRGKRYVCEKITATFTENGMSQLLKGDFYPVVETDD